VGDIKFGLLGPLTVSRGGVAVPVRRGNERAVLAALLLRANQVVLIDQLAELLWGTEPPPSARVTVRNYVKRLRQSLGEDGRDLIEAQPHGYLIRVGAAELDVSRFEALLAWGGGGRARAPPPDAWRLAAAQARAALTLWRGEPLADVGPGMVASREVPRLVELRWQALETRIEADLHLGGRMEVIAELQGLAAAEPLREQVHGFLMLALYRSGRQGEALAVFRQVRALLAEELGLEPGPQLQELHQRILQADPALTGTGSVPPGDSRPDDGRWPPLFQLPAAPPDFTGRRPEQDLVLGTLAHDDVVPVVAICGQPGIGKTALALHTAHRARHRFPDGQLWVQLAGASARPRDPAEVLGELLRACGIPGSALPGDLADRASLFRSRIADRRLVIVADDAASAEQVAPLLPGTAGCALVVTSRMRLEGLASARIVPLDVLTRPEAVVLLGRILGQARIAADPAGAAELAGACGELPLALRVAGARLATRPSWPLPTMTRRLTSLRGRLRELQTGNLSVRAGIAASYDLLPERHQRAFRLLSVLGPADFAEWVVPVLLGEPDTAGVLDDLLSRSLVSTTGVDATGEPRYRLHDLLRDYAAERLRDDPVPSGLAASNRLLTAYLQLAIQASNRLPPQPYFPPPVFCPRPTPLPAELAAELTADALAWFTSERQNLLAAVELACAASQSGLARELADSQGAYQHLQDRNDDAERSWSLLADRGDVYPRLRVAASLVERGRVAEALPLLDWCAGQDLDIGMRAQVMYWRASSAWDLDDASQVRRLARHSMALARQAALPQVEFLSTRLLTHALFEEGETDAAMLTVESAMSLAEVLGEAPYELAALHSLATAYVLTGQYDRSIQVCQRRIEVSRELGDVRGEAHSYGVLGDAYAGQGRWELAIQSLQRARPVFEKHHAQRDYGMCLLKLGYAYEGLGRYGDGAQHLAEALEVFQRLRLTGRAETAERALNRCREASRG
jgi:DNA-binding SARP family transcriptional activator/tetratricopeptide (TPR) repeat protein